MNEQPTEKEEQYTISTYQVKLDRKEKNISKNWMLNHCTT